MKQKLCQYSVVTLFAVSIIILLNIIFTQDIVIENSKLLIILSNVGFSIFIVSIITMSRLLFIYLFSAILLAGSILSYFKFFFNININESLVFNIISTNKSEISSFIEYRLILWISTLWIIPTIIFCIKSQALTMKITKKIQYISIFSLIGAIIFYIPLFLVKDINPIIFLHNITAAHLYPSNTVIALKKYLKHHAFKTNDKKINIFAKYSFYFSEQKDIKVILVIGESARSDRFGINSHHRNTTPKLSKIKNLVSFKDAYSLGTYTIVGINNIFKVNPLHNEQSIISLFNAVGFKSSWFSIQSFVNDINNIASEAHELVTKEMILQDYNYNIQDENLIYYLNHSLTKNKGLNQFIVLHTQGSHRTYDDKYLEKFKFFYPTCKDKNNQSTFKKFFQRNSCEYKRESGNSYDNTIVYTDHVLNNIISHLQAYRSILIYVSDHGESLGENGIYLHSYDYKKAPKEQIHIPYLLWFSDIFLQNSSIITQNLKMAQCNSKKVVDHSTVLYSLLDCVGIQSNFIDKRKSICSKSLGEGIKFGK